LNLFEIVKQYFVASLFNNFLPTAIGGDGVRFYMLAKLGVSKTKAGLMIAIERFIGFYALFVIAFVSSFFWNIPEYLFNILMVATVVYSIVLLVVFFRKEAFTKVKFRFLSKLSDSFEEYRGNLSLFITTIVISLCFQMLSIYISYYMVLVLNLEASFFAFLTLVPIVWIFTMAPISLGGIGIREVSFAFLLSIISITREESLVISLGTYLTLVLSGGIGAIFMIYDRIHKMNKGETIERR
jgi:hypothetical protein